MIIWPGATVFHLCDVTLSTRCLTIVQAKTKYLFLRNLKEECRTNPANNRKGASSFTVNLTLLIRFIYVCVILKEIRRIIISGEMSYSIVSRNERTQQYYKKSRFTLHVVGKSVIDILGESTVYAFIRLFR